MLVCAQHTPWCQPVRSSLGRLAIVSHGQRGLATEKAKTKTPKTPKIPKTPDFLKTTTPIAEKLHKTGYWRSRVKKNDPYAMRPLDALRVNIVSEKLCDDVIKTIGPSLQRHKGCDLIDINPGASLWSKALHDCVQPRRHMMLESDPTYLPFIKKAMDSRPHEVIPKSGYIWSELNEFLESHISPHHKQHPQGEQPEKNDTLLVSINVSTYPKRTLFSFDCLSTMITYQLLQSIRTSTHFQRYGAVRMLLWVDEDVKRSIVSRTVGGRKRAAFEAEISCEWVHEVVGCDLNTIQSDRLHPRDDWINKESAAGALKRMREADIPIIPGRETRMLKEILANPDLQSGPLAGHRPPHFSRPFIAELDQIREGNSDVQDMRRLKHLQLRESYSNRDAAIYLDLLQKSDRAMTLDPSSAEFKGIDQAYNETVDNLKKNALNEFYTIKDAYHLFRHGPHPVLLWDRRKFEPLAAEVTEFYPNSPTCLLDLQPKIMNPLFLQYGTTTSRMGNISDLLLRVTFYNLGWPVATRTMDSFWPGFAELASSCPSFYDPKQGGSPISGYGALVNRCLNEASWTEMMQAWSEWPFRPTYSRLIGRFVDDPEGPEEGDTGFLGNRVGMSL